MDIYTIYAIYNRAHNKIYIGQTRNLQQRLDLHNRGTFANSYTSRYSGKWLIIYTEKVATRQDALMRERQLKSYRGREFIKQHIPR